MTHRHTLLALLLALATGAGHGFDASDIRQETRRHAAAVYTPLAAAQWQQAVTLFRAILVADTLPTPEQMTRWQALGYRVQALDADRRYALLPARPDAAAEGIFLFDAGSERRDAVQAPHLRDDLGSGELVIRLFFAGGLFAAMTSTVRREEIDLAHADGTLFTAFAAALATRPDSRLLQLHGFERDKRDSEAGRNADSVSSGGRPWPTSPVITLRDCLQREFGGLHRVYAIDIDELGGTRNASFAQFPTPHTGFLHLELSREFRGRLLAGPADQNRFFRCLLP